MDVNVYWIPISLGLGFCAMMIAIFYFSSKSKSDRARYQAEVQARLIDKFGSGPEFITFLQSPQGRQFMGEIESGPTQARIRSPAAQGPSIAWACIRSTRSSSIRSAARRSVSSRNAVRF